MNIRAARSVADAWVREEGALIPGFSGAFLAGSTNDLPDEAELERTSDLDIMVVLEAADVPVKPGKFRYRGVLLEVSVLDAASMRNAETVLGHYHLGRAIATARILSDPSGHLQRLKDDVARQFADRAWISARTRQAAETVISRVDSIETEETFEKQVMAWLFAAGGLPHVLLVAGLRNPTVRKRYVAARGLIRETGHKGRLYEEMLDLLDPHHLPAARIRHHLGVLAEAFDTAGRVVCSPVFFASDLSAEARPLAIDGSRELIESGMHREAIFWIVATFCRCQIVLHADAERTVAHRWDDAFRDLARDLGVGTTSELRRRGEAIRAFLPTVMAAAEEISDGVAPTGSP